MKYLKVTWIRVLVSLFAGGLISELIHISTGDPNRERGGGTSIIVMFAALIVYLLLTNLVNKDPGGSRLK